MSHYATISKRTIKKTRPRVRHHWSKQKMNDRFIVLSVYQNLRSIIKSNRLLRMIYFMTFLSSLLHSPVNASRTFSHDCSANARLKCRVQEGVCDNNTSSENYPSAPHDLRISPYIVPSHAKLGSYQLWVNISWKPTYEKSLSKTDGFELNIFDKHSGEHLCFAFQLESPKWEDKDRDNSIRFQLSTVDVFDFGQHYVFEISSLPKSSSNSNAIATEMTMPVHPENALLDQLNQTGYFDASATTTTTAHCASPSLGDHFHGAGAHPHANKWVAAFRDVFIHPKLKLIFAEFVAAPAQYCFEEYELRLLKDFHYIINRTRIRTEDLYHEIHGNVSVAFGNYTFFNVSPGEYEIGVVPIAYSRIDSRCLCPSIGRVCTCSQAVWPEVVMQEPSKIEGPPANPCNHVLNRIAYDCPEDKLRTGELDIGSNGVGSGVPTNVIALTCVLTVALLIMVICCIYLRRFYKRYKKRAAPRLYILPIRGTTEFELKSSFGDDSSATEMAQILHPVKLLVIYSHDCPEHEAAVQAFCEYLRERCVCEVSVDYLCFERIASNKFDWAYKSILDADRVLLVNSYGAYFRYQAKLITNINESSDNGKQYLVSTVVERAQAGLFDDLFLLQLDLIAQCEQRDPKIGSKLSSVRFSYTSAQYALPQANPGVTYEVPQHLRTLVGHLHGLDQSISDFEEDSFAAIPPRLRGVDVQDYYKCDEGEHLRQCIASMKRLTEESSDWFERLHIRRPAAIPNIVRSSPTKPPSPSKIRYASQPRLEDSEQLESLLSPYAPLSVLPAKPASTVDSGFDEQESHVVDSGVIGSNDFLTNDCKEVTVPLSNLNSINEANGFVCDHIEKLPQTNANLDSCDSGISADFNRTPSGTFCNDSSTYSPKNGFLRQSPKTEKLLNQENRRLIC